MMQLNEVYLQPGEYFFGTGGCRVRTVLGSCVSLVLWHRQARVGGMCHYMLPSRGGARSGPLSGMYGDEAMQLLLQEASVLRLPLKEFQVRLFGGGDMFPGLGRVSGRSLIGQQNVLAAKKLIELHQLNCISSHVEGIGHRLLAFDIATGQVTLRLPQQSSLK